MIELTLEEARIIWDTLGELPGHRSFDSMLLLRSKVESVKRVVPAVPRPLIVKR